MSIRRHTIYNLMGQLIPLAASLVTVPIYLKRIGEARYGVLAIAWLLLGYFGLFDLGLGRATAQCIASLHDAAPRQRAQAFWTALTLNVGLGVIGGLFIWPVAYYFFGHVFKVEDAMRPEIQAAVPWLILAVPMATLTGVLGGALQGRERFLEINLISIAGTVLFQVLPLVAAMLWGPNLNLLLPAALFSRLFTLLMLFLRCQRHVICGFSPSFDRVRSRQLLGFGGWVTTTSFVSPMMVSLDRFIIGAIAGAKAVTFYTIPFQFSQRSTILGVALSSALFPRLAAASPQEEIRLAQEGLHTLLVVMTPFVVLGLFVIKSFLAWWITPAFAELSARVGQVLLLGFWANTLAIIPLEQLQARNRPDLVAKCHLVEVLPYFGLLYFGLTHSGMIGAAFAFSIRAFADFALLAGLAGTLRAFIEKLWQPAGLFVSAFLIATHAGQGQPFSITLRAALLVLTLGWAVSNAPSGIKIMVRSKLNFLARIPRRP